MGVVLRTGWEPAITRARPPPGAPRLVFRNRVCANAQWRRPGNAGLQAGTARQRRTQRTTARAEPSDVPPVVAFTAVPGYGCPKDNLVEPLTDLYEWLSGHRDDHSALFLTRLSYPETQSLGNVSGLSLRERDVPSQLFPELARHEKSEPGPNMQLLVDSHGETIPIRVVTRGATAAAEDCPYAIVPAKPGPCRFLDPELCGVLMILAVPPHEGAAARNCHLWIARSVAEEGVMESSFGGFHYRWALQSPGTSRWSLT